MSFPIELIEIKTDDTFIVELIYRTDKSFFPTPVYKDFGIEKCFAHPDLYQKLLLLKPKLQEKNLKLKIYDVYRPVAVQRLMWDILPDNRYVAHPDEGSNHNRGVAIDCYLLSAEGKALEFPTAPDGYIPGIEQDMKKWFKYLERAHHTYVCSEEERHLCKNRDMFRELMESVGLCSIEEEWWHYELPDSESYPLIEMYSGE